VDLEYGRCEDDGKDESRLFLSQIGFTGTGQPVEVGLPEISAIFGLKAAAYGTTMAMRSGVVGDFTTRVAIGFASEIARDPHALCPLVDVVNTTAALLLGNPVGVREADKALQVLVGKGPDWLKLYFVGERGRLIYE
jgi:hypothetical protein